jgi:peroxidase
VDNIDLWVGGLAENHVSGSNLGPTFQRIVVNEFRRARDGDRYWYQRYLSFSEQYSVDHTSLADIIRRNSTLTNLQDNVFVFNVQATGRVWNDRDGDGRFDSTERGIIGRHVNLLDDTGQVIASTTTSSGGTYRFTGIQIGDYSVRPELPDGWQLTTSGSQAIAVTRGQRIDNLNFGQRRLPMLNVSDSGTDAFTGASDATDRTDGNIASMVLDV